MDTLENNGPATEKNGKLPKAFWILIGWAILCISGALAAGVYFYKHPVSSSDSASKKVRDGSLDEYSSDDSSDGSGLVLRDEYGNDCNVVKLRLRGTLTTYVPDGWYSDSSLSSEELDVTTSDSMLSLLDKAEHEDQVKAIVLEVDSGGGSPVAGEEIGRAVHSSTKPVVGHIRSMGASAAYWAVSGAEHIIASKNSDVGSIGVTMSYMENARKDEKFIQISSGKYKDTGNPGKPITEEEKNLLLRDVKNIHNNFIQTVSDYRHLSYERVRDIADGSTVLGDAAKALGLIDEIGSYPEVSAYLEDVIHEKPVICTN